MKNHAVLEVDLVHVREYNAELGDGLENRPAEFLPLVRVYVCVCVCARARGQLQRPGIHGAGKTPPAAAAGVTPVRLSTMLRAAAVRAPRSQFERACKEVLQEDHQLTAEGEEQAFDDVQVLLFSSQPFGPASMRQLNSNRVSQLVQISGIITSASKPKVRGCCLSCVCVCGGGGGGGTDPSRS
jgi:DNA replicative helicase MCM subunit Mcm2 (Cdc46/Mcm family)